MSRNELKARWLDGGTTYGLWSVTGSTFVTELMALEGPDYVCLDIQHGLIGYDAFLSCLYGLARTGSTPVVRVPANDGGWIGKVLDAGAEVVIVPMIETAEQAEQAVRSCRYYPQGNRSVGPIRAAQTLGGDHRRREPGGRLPADDRDRAGRRQRGGDLLGAGCRRHLRGTW